MDQNPGDDPSCFRFLTSKFALSSPFHIKNYTIWPQLQTHLPLSQIGPKSMFSKKTVFIIFFLSPRPLFLESHRADAMARA
jgi:hypothetical protein